MGVITVKELHTYLHGLEIVVVMFILCFPKKLQRQKHDE